MLQDPNHCGEEFGWDDETEDDLVDNLVVKTFAGKMWLLPVILSRDDDNAY